jgi:ATP-dependent Clp protease adaptor protein ClpS
MAARELSLIEHRSKAPQRTRAAHAPPGFHPRRSLACGTEECQKRLYTRLKEQGRVVTFSMSRLLRKQEGKFADTLVTDSPCATLEAPTIEKEEATKEEIEMPWNVIVHNDPVNLMSYVTMVFQRVFGYPRERAEKHMLEVHNNGRSILWSGVRERAELYVQQLHGYLLLATIEKTV